MVNQNKPASGDFFRIPPVVCYGSGASQQVGSLLRQEGIARVLVVTDEGVVKAGLVDRITATLAGSGVSYEIFAGVQPEPILHNVEEALRRFRSGGHEALLAVGGGSSIDCAKAVSISDANDEYLGNFQGMEKVPRGGPPVFAVPTTAGTGSEVSRALVITDTERSVKMMIASRFAVCRAAIVDPELTVGLPKPITAATGVDALAHALEAYVSRRAQPITDVLALSAIRRISRNLRRAYHHGADLAARTEVMIGATEAGMAFSNSSVALIHGMARPLGAFFHLPHGVCVAVLLPLVTRHSWHASPKRYADVMEAMGERQPGESDESAASRLPEVLQRLVDDVEIRPLAQQPGVDPAYWPTVIDTMAQQALDSGSPQYNPWLADHAQIAGLYRELFAAGEPGKNP